MSNVFFQSSVTSTSFVVEVFCSYKICSKSKFPYFFLPTKAPKNRKKNNLVREKWSIFQLHHCLNLNILCIVLQAYVNWICNGQSPRLLKYFRASFVMAAEIPHLQNTRGMQQINENSTARGPVNREDEATVTFWNRLGMHVWLFWFMVSCYRGDRELLWSIFPSIFVLYGST